jgi:hypothetical protein
MDRIPLANRNVFIVGGITHVPPEEYPDHLHFLMQMANMLRFRYELNPSFALLDNEVWLKDVPRDSRAQECYRIDQASVDWAGLVIAELSVPSTGTGQELERAFQNNTPVVVMAKQEMRREVTPSIEYYTEGAKGKVDKHKVQRGAGGISLMIEGNPSVVGPPIIYGNNGHAGRSEALHRLDEVLQERFGLAPITRRIERAMNIDSQTLKTLDPSDTAKREKLAAEMERLATMRDMADSLLEFSPTKYDPKHYERVFGFIPRLPLADLEKGLTEPTHLDIRPTQKRKAEKH